MTTLEIPPPPKNCERCYQPVRTTLISGQAVCSRGHQYQFDRKKAIWQQVGRR